MAISLRTSTTAGATTGTGDRSGAATTPVVGDLFVVFCVAAINTNDNPTCTDGNGGTYDTIWCEPFQVTGAADSRFSCFIRRQLLPNTTATTVTVATGSNTAGQIVTLAFAGASALRTGYKAIRQVYGHSGTGNIGRQANLAASSTPNPRLGKPALTGNATIAAIGYDGTTAGGTFTAGSTTPSGWTERQDAGQNTPAVGLAVCTRDSGFTGVDIVWGNAPTSPMASIALELDGSVPTSQEEYLSDRGYVDTFWTPEWDLGNEQNISAAVQQFILINTSLGVAL